MAEFPMHHCRLPDNSDVNDSSENNIGPSAILKRGLEKYGFTMQKELGRGISGVVFLVTDADGDRYAVKQMNSRDKKDLDPIKKEVENLRSLDHGYIVSYVDSYEDEEAGLFYIVMEYCARGDLSQKMQTQKENGCFEEQQILDWLVQICLALQHLHENNVLHRDMKPQNVFLTEDEYINLGDFGCSKTLERADAYASSVLGAGLYVSPEVHQKKYNSKSDIWSLGWILHDLCMLDVWSDTIERDYARILSMKGNQPHISETYSMELQELIKEMLSCDPNRRPSADQILAKPFLSDAVNRNKRIPEALKQRFMESFRIFDEAYNEHYTDFEALVSDWGTITDSLEGVHRKCTAGSLSGSVIGAAGGITALVGAILAPFTFGASLIVSGVGLGLGVAGGITGAASSITNTVKQKSLRDNLKNIKQNYENVSKPILIPLNTLRGVLRKIQKFKDFVSNSTFESVQISCNVGNSKVLSAKALMNLSLLTNVGRFAAQTARVGRVAAAAVSGVVSALLIIVDAAFVVKDSMDIHQMRQGKIDDPEKVKPGVLQAIAQMRKTHNDLRNVLEGIKETREYAGELKERMARVDTN